MALNHEAISRRINRQLKDIGIQPEVNGQPSHTANLVSIIVKEIVAEIQSKAEVATVVNTAVNTQGVSASPGMPEFQLGTGTGKGTGRVF